MVVSSSSQGNVLRESIKGGPPVRLGQSITGRRDERTRLQENNTESQNFSGDGRRKKTPGVVREIRRKRTEGPTGTRRRETGPHACRHQVQVNNSKAAKDFEQKGESHQGQS